MKIEITDVTDRAIGIMAIPFFATVCIVVFVIVYYITRQPVG